MADESPPKEERKDVQPEFKKPVLVGRIGKLPKKAKCDTTKAPETTIEAVKPNEIQISIQNPIESGSKSSLPPAILLKELSTPIPYKEPKWSGMCPDGSGYALEVLKSGCILERIDLTTKPFYVFGRLANCDVVMAHPTISRHHAVLQYKAYASETDQPPGWYLYELGSTHGTFLNKIQLKNGRYTRVRVGHQIKFGNSTRTYALMGPDFDCEGESELTVTEIKQRAEVMRVERDRMIQEATEQRERNRIEEEKKREDHGIDWGMGEDAEEEPDLSDNPFAVTTNEELYLDDPKKTLRGYFEREGHELTYDCDERGHGQYICRVELPMDDARGRPVVAEAIHTGKKKEAVIACALEACRILDRAGLLRQAKHESRRRKSRDWSARDYYDSDDDTFLDRTGHVETKRSRRITRHGGRDHRDHEAVTYDDLLKRIEDIQSKISEEEKTLDRLRKNKPANKPSSEDLDDLDAYMDTLTDVGQSMAVKADISKTKMSIQKLKAELSESRRLAEVARPACPRLPPLVLHHGQVPSRAPVRVNNSVIYGKRIKLKEDEKRVKPKPTVKKEEEDEFVEEVDSDEDVPQTTLNAANDEEDKRTVDKTEKNDAQSETKHREFAGKTETEDQKDLHKSEREVQRDMEKKVYGPMRPPENYVIPEDYFNQQSDRDLPEIMEKE